MKKTILIFLCQRRLPVSKTLKHFIILVFLIFAGGHLTAQPISPQTSPAFLEFNTGIDPAYYISSTYNNILTPGSLDAKWQVARGNSSGPTSAWVAAKVVDLTTVPNACSWSPANNTTNHNTWITYPSFGCSPLTSYSCASAPLDVYYRYVFTLSSNPNPVFLVGLKIFAAGWVQDIKVNGIMALNSYATPTNYPAWQMQNGFDWSWCSNWGPGNNEIIIHVANDPNTPASCKNTGLKVESWGPMSSWGYPTITGSALVCSPSSNVCFSIPNMTTYAGHPTAATSYSWTKPASWSGGITGNQYCAATSGTNSGIFSVMAYSLMGTGSHTNIFCHSTAAFSVTVPPLTITPTSTSICQGNAITLTASGGQPATYTWFNPPSTTSFTTGAVISVNPNASTTYSVKAKTPVGGCIYSKVVSITVLTSPTIGIIASPPILCSGATAALTATGGTTSYTWQTSPTTTQIINPLSVTPLVTTSYTVTGKLAFNGCKGKSIITITVVPTPTLTATASPPVICPGDASTLTVSGATTYTWAAPVSSNNNTVQVTPSSTTVYSVSGTTNNCTSKALVTVLVSPSPTVTVNPPYICSGISNTLTASGAMLYTWNIGGTVFTGPSVVITVTATTSYTVCGTAGNLCSSCTSSVLTIGSPVPLSVTNLTLCTNAGSCTNIAVTSTLSAPVNYTWQTVGVTGAILTGMSGSTLNVCPTVQSIYTVSATSPSGCPSSATMAVALASNCCSQSTASLTTLTSIGGTLANTSYLLNNSQTLTASTSFSNSEVWITEGVTLTVPSGMFLDLDQTHLYACGINMWQGIVVQDGGRVTTPAAGTRTANSIIEDAIVGIDLDNISHTNSGSNPPIDIQRMIFNKNFIGIKISNSVTNLDTLALGITGCVFSSRDMTFTTYPASPLLWPSSEMNCTLGGLRCPANPTTGLVPPYTFSCTQANLKQPYTMQPGHIGIKIENIGDPSGIIPSTGVDIGVTYPGYITNDFNLFDGLGEGIDVTDASLDTKNNTFQNMQYYPYTPSATGMFGGIGIKHNITGLMNAKLSLKGTSGNDDGNFFWDCNTGVQVFNVYDCWVSYALFRSSHTATTAMIPTPMPGDTGISMYTNRFDFTVKESQFNNLKYGIVFNTPANTYSYNFNAAGPAPMGICVRGLVIERNYFGPEVTSLTAYNGGAANVTEYMGDAIQLNTPNTTGWAYHPTAVPSNIISNKIDRAFRGVAINGMEDAPLNIGGNTFFIEDDYTFGAPAFGFGISVMNNIDSLAVKVNTLDARDWNGIPGNQSVSLVYCDNNSGTQSPRIECNSVTRGFYGFQFNGNNPNTVWEGNVMCWNQSGLALTNSAVIGPQGTSSLGCGNIWSNACGANWNTAQAPYQTYCYNSDPTLSVLYVRNISITHQPLYNSSNFGNPTYLIGPSIDNTPPADRLNDCVGNNPYLPAPNWRTANQGTLTLPGNDNILNENTISVYPNPTNGQLTILSEDKGEDISVTILDLTGKVMFFKRVTNSANTIDLSELAPSMYLIELKNQDDKVIRKKLIKTN